MVLAGSQLTVEARAGVAGEHGVPGVESLDREQVPGGRPRSWPSPLASAPSAGPPRPTSVLPSSTNGTQPPVPGDRDEREREAARHWAAAATDLRRAEHGWSMLSDEQTAGNGPGADQGLNRRAVKQLKYTSPH